MIDETSQERTMHTIHTTVGELISAIAEAAQEATIDDEDLSVVTHLILQRLLRGGKD